jgi:hemerythrin-like domain-containing protein
MDEPLSPQRRHRALVPLSHDHHHGLVAAVRMKQGRSPYRDIADSADAVRRLWLTELDPHFAKEESILFTQSYSSSLAALVARAVEEHAAMRAIVGRFAEGGGDDGALRTFGELLERHIRFEERELFPGIQEELGDAALTAIGEAMASGS